MMLRAPRSLADACVLLTNDDGIDAPGLALMAELLQPQVKHLVVVAPEVNQSGCGHRVQVAHPLRLRQVGGAQRYAVDGTPPDCVLMGIREVMKDNPPDLVLSGINSGHNIAEYVHYSGTCAACYEAGLIGLPSVAFSQQGQSGQAMDYDAARGWLVEVLRRILAQGWPGECFLNVNFPARPAVQVDGMVLTRLGRVLQGTGFVRGADPRGRTYYWNDWCDDILNAIDAAPDTDLAAMMRGSIGVTPVAIDQTDHAALAQLRQGLAA